eukprot:TRINITY_DN23908_c0_g1_i1.p1 TRINITY_DN23908_c0_g1~~TRINITY_DN23908_c0_g1_i1.p1  ORF type:complete len:1914 (+),score=347.51 TRINITY_DN23908_c0_g1_i1:40-5781(+)
MAPAKFDVTPEGPPAGEVGRTICQCLAVRGFCFINPDIRNNILQEALQEIQGGAMQERLKMPCDEILDALLGEAGSARVAELALPGQERADGASLMKLDVLLADVQRSCERLFPSVLGFAAPNRTPGLLHEAENVDHILSEHQAPELDDAECAKWLETLSGARILCVLFLGPSTTTLEMCPFQDDEAEILAMEVQPGSVVLVRADMLSHEIQPLDQGQAYFLSCFFSEEFLTSSSHPYRDEVTTPTIEQLEQWMYRRMSEVKGSQEEGEDYMATVERQMSRQSGNNTRDPQVNIHKQDEEEEKEVLLQVNWIPFQLGNLDAMSGLGKTLIVGAGLEMQQQLAPLFPGADFSSRGESLAELDPDTVLFVAAVDDAELMPEMEVLHAAMQLSRECIFCLSRNGRAPLQWWITRGTQAVGSGGTYFNAGLWGMARTFRMEQPKLKLRCLDLDPQVYGPDGVAAELASWLGVLTASETREMQVSDAAGPGDEVAVRRPDDGGDDQIFVSRLVPSDAEPKRPMCLLMPQRGSLTGLILAPQDKRTKPQAGQAEIRVRAIGLNFRDVLNVMGLYPGDPGHPGADCAGTITAVAPDIMHLRCGDDVFGESMGCLKTYNTFTAALLTQKPKTWTYEGASSIPVIFVTVEEPFSDIAKIKKGDRVLIHAAAGGVGLVAIQYCQFVGAIVYATCSDGKRAYLRSLGVERITTTRNDEQFEEDMKRMLAEDGADGIDCVLNSLTHDDYVGRSLRLLAQGGKFMEISKRDVWSHDEMRAARPDVLYEKIAVDQMMLEEPWRFNGYLKRLLKRVDDGGLTLINMHIFEGMDRGIEALQFLQKAQNIGKVVISNPSLMGCREEAEYVLSGGTGSLGILSAHFLVEEGAKYINLLTRSGRVVPDVEDKWEWLQASSATVQLRICDVSSMEAVQQLADDLEFQGRHRTPPTSVGGVLHLAFVLDDAPIQAMKKKHLESTFGGKVFGARHLHSSLSKDMKSLDFMVLFSSSSTIFGIPTQANYSAANASIDAHAWVWKQRGENACSIQYGPWRDVGMAVKIGAVPVLKSKGFGSLSNAFGLAALAGSLALGSPSTVLANPMYWERYLKQYKVIPTFFAAFAPGQESSVEHEEQQETSSVEAASAVPLWWQKAMNHLTLHGNSIIVSGMGCRCPVGVDSDTWYQGLAAGSDCVIEVPSSRWEHSQFYDPDPSCWENFKTFCKHGAFMEGTDLFDMKTFNISKAEATIMDPNQRSMLEVGYDALCRAGYRKSSLFNCYGGVFVGTPVWNEWQTSPGYPKESNTYTSTSTQGSIASNRVSFCLGLKGPSMTLDSGDASGLAAVRVGSENLLAGASKTAGAMEFALTAGMRLLLSAQQWPEMQAAGMLSDCGRCFSFDASARGPVLGESVAVIILTSQETAGGQASGRIAGSAVNFSGEAASMTSPSAAADLEVIRDALRSARLSPGDIDAVECHALGSPLADAVECAALVRALRGHPGSSDDRPVGLLAVRPNAGNTQHAGGTLGLMHALAALSWGFVSPLLHLQVISPQVDVSDFSVSFVTNHLDVSEASSFVGVSARGFGTNVHVVLWGCLDEKKRPPPAGPEALPRSECPTFWPGGGGELEDSEPVRGYYVAGSWSSWAKPEMMEEESADCFALTVRLGRGRCEEFQIWLDADAEKALHPGAIQSAGGTEVFGPSADCPQHTWRICSPIQAQEHRSGAEDDVLKHSSYADDIAEAALAESSEQKPEQDHSVSLQSSPTAKEALNEYRIRLHVAGKWRLVDWQQVVDGKEMPPCWDGVDTLPPLFPVSTRPQSLSYHIMGSWSCWTLEEMECDGSGTNFSEIQLESGYEEFQIALDGDWDRVLYPGCSRAGIRDANPVHGPDDSGQGRNWLIEGKPGDRFRVELVHKCLFGKQVYEISWRRLLEKRWYARK